MRGLSGEGTGNGPNAGSQEATCNKEPVHRNQADLAGTAQPELYCLRSQRIAKRSNENLSTALGPKAIANEFGDLFAKRLQFTLPFGFFLSKSSGSLPLHDSCTANPSGMIKNGKNVVSPFTAISSVQTAQ